MAGSNLLETEPDEEHPVSARTYRIANVCTAAVVSVLGAYLIISGVGYGLWDDTRPGPGFFPLCIGLVVLLLGLLWLALAITGRLIREDDSSTPDRQGARNILLSIGVVIGFALVVDPLGFFIPFSLMLFILFAVIGRRSWWMAIIVSLIMTAAITALFRVALSVPLPISPIPGLNLIGV